MKRVVTQTDSYSEFVEQEHVVGPPETSYGRPSIHYSPWLWTIPRLWTIPIVSVEFITDRLFSPKELLWVENMFLREELKKSLNNWFKDEEGDIVTKEEPKDCLNSILEQYLGKRTSLGTITNPTECPFPDDLVKMAEESKDEVVIADRMNWSYERKGQDIRYVRRLGVGIKRIGGEK